MEKIPLYMLNWIKNQQKGGKAEPNLQDKTETITTNTTTIIEPDSGYDGLAKVTITTNVHSRIILPEGIKFEYSLMSELPSFLVSADTTYMYDFSRMFYNCASLIEGNFDNWDFSASNTTRPEDVTVHYMFKTCNVLNDDTLNSILLALQSLPQNYSEKSLLQLGLEPYQINKCLTLENWQPLAASGWVGGV